MNKKQNPLKSVRVKLFATISIVIVSIIVFLIVVNNFVLGQFYLYSKRQTLKSVYQTVNDYYNDEQDGSLETELEQIAIQNNFDILIRNNQNINVYTSNKNFYATYGQMNEMTSRLNTGDGELTAIELLNVITGTNKSLNELSKVMKKYPQVLINTPVSNDKKNNFYTDNVIIEEIKKYEEKLNETGRIVIRPSGTEPLIRVMIEGENEKIIKEYAQKLADFIKEKMN